MSSKRPNHISLQNLVIFGDSGVGKTCLTDMFMMGHHYSRYDPTLEDSVRKQHLVDDKVYILELVDLNASLLREGDPNFSHNFMRTTLQNADGVLLLYDITSKASFHHLTTDAFQAIIVNRKGKAECGTSYPCGGQRAGFVLVGTKLDLAKEKREVGTEEAREWAEAHGMAFMEMDAHSQEPISNAITVLVRSNNEAQRKDEDDIARVKGKSVERGKSSKYYVVDRDSAGKGSKVKGAFQKVFAKSPT